MKERPFDSDSPLHDTEIEPEVRESVSPVDRFKTEFLKSLGDVISPEQLQLFSIQASWQSIAGNLARHTYPIAVRGQKLIVQVEKSIYSQEITMRGRNILQQIRDELGVDVSSIKVEAGVFEMQAPFRENAGITETSEPLPADLRRRLSAFRKGEPVD